MTKSIVCMQQLSPRQQELILAAAPGYSLTLGDSRNPDLALLSSAEVIIGWGKGIQDTVLRPGSPLRWVQAWSAGVEKLPLDALKERGVLLTNASGVHAEPITAVIFSFMLMFTRNMHTAIRNQQSRRWHSDGQESELTGKTAVICGTGAIGSETARIAKAFRMKTIGVSRSGRPVQDFDQVFTTGDLKSIVSQADFIINTLPITDETEGLFAADIFSACKQGAYYINIGRGATTNTDDLITALRSGQLAGAGLDVFETEPLPQDSPLWGMEQVIMTPHCAGATDRYADRIVDIFTGNMTAYLATGAPSRNLVDYSRQY
ncbi:D-2-hydroxyacid dehydrogenase [Paenibacillus sp. MMS20-IR301]|uniref:D-2-hydroxyacid dehydrogenase n=1 Tax=Paenibacillus sp. MMS20-IR301 TaxID=2895946 RepID=UPI0028E50EBF|nr:D-2-hydroxyacid dehydrogenase [Paenibacillus sp. MMS20-IR301]WNS41251.1 D-2-hydroxyacid dehydrogenase [Paenibacillus sp. MMS20-IR301]